MENQVSYKLMTNYRTIIHVTKIDICNLMKNANLNLFLTKPFLSLKAAFPNAIFKCPFKVQTLKYLLVSY